MYYKDLEVWKKSIELVKSVYLLTNNFPDNELYGLVSQIKRAVISIPSNIAEGVNRYSDKDKYRFIDIAFGSLAEVETQLIIAKELNYVDNIENQMQILKQVNALLLGLKKYLNSTK